MGGGVRPQRYNIRTVCSIPCVQYTIGRLALFALANECSRRGLCSHITGAPSYFRDSGAVNCQPGQRARPAPVPQSRERRAGTRRGGPAEVWSVGLSLGAYMCVHDARVGLALGGWGRKNVQKTRS